MLLNIAVQPIAEPVSLDEAKLFLRVSDTSEDDLISSLITSARSYCEVCTRRCFMTTTFDYYLDSFGTISGGYFNRLNRQNPTLTNFLPNTGYISLPRPPLQSVTSIRYYDTQDVLQTVNTSAYIVKLGSEGIGAVTVQYGSLFPIALSQIDSVIIRFVAGYTSVDTVPEGIKTAIKFLVNHWYSHRLAVSDAAGVEVPLGVNALLAPFQYGSYV